MAGAGAGGGGGRPFSSTNASKVSYREKKGSVRRLVNCLYEVNIYASGDRGHTNAFKVSYREKKAFVD